MTALTGLCPRRGLRIRESGDPDVDMTGSLIPCNRAARSDYCPDISLD
jgi:hypothetical protein